uniref:Putative secreted protein n=1 Tax=Amblyomma triste TaxID=251400 RepID=A0A023G9A7_AMBTT
MRHLSAAFVLVVAFSNLSYGGPADPADPADPAGSADAGTTGSLITKEKFLQKIESSGPYWTWMTTYQDPKQTQKRTCISTEKAEAYDVNADAVLLQKYKFKGCHWSTYTHDAYYNVTFQETSSPTDDLKMQWVPIPHVTQLNKPDAKVYGTARNYSFQYWDDEEDCFVLTFTSEADKRNANCLYGIQK